MMSTVGRTLPALSRAARTARTNSSELPKAEIAPTVSLYVNEWNEPARRAYRSVGFAETARFSTIMF